MDKIKLISRIFLGFISSLLLLALILCIILKLTVFNKSYLLETIDNSNYYELTTEEIQKDMENSLLSSGLDKSVLNNLVTKADVKNDVINLVDSIYSGNSFKLSTDEITEKLNSNIDEFLKKNNITITDKKSLETYTNKITKVYEDEIGLYGYLNDYVSKFVKIGNIILILIPILTLLILINICIIRFKLDGKYSGVITFSSALMLIYIKIYILEKIDIQNLLVISKSFSSVIKKVLTDINDYILFGALILIIISLMLNIINSFRKKRRIRKVT